MVLSITSYKTYPISVMVVSHLLAFAALVLRRHFWIFQVLKVFILGISLGIISISFSQYYNPTDALDKKKFVPKLEGRIVEVTPAPYGYRLKIAVHHRVKKRLKKNLTHVKLTHRIKGERQPCVGDIISVNAVLTPFSEALISGGFDFRENNRAQGIGASGFTVAPITLLQPDTKTYTEFWQRIRQKITNIIINIPSKNPQVNAIAASLITGQKSLISNDVRSDFAASGLAHILAISGLHMNLMALIAFFCVKFFLCRFPGILERIHLPKISASMTLVLLFFYWNISGQSMSSTRAFFMAAFVLVGILMDREGLSLHFINLAAILILLMYPEAYKLPSFQMSFFVVLGLISLYEACPQIFVTNDGGWLRQVIVSIRNLVMTSLIASIIILPFSIMHFHTLSVQGILANIIVIPLLGTLILPGLVLGLLVASLTGYSFVLALTFHLIDYVTYLAQLIASWPGAKLHVAHPPLWSFLLCIIGLLWFCVWRYQWR